jgi:predicted phosphodiesterase
MRQAYDVKEESGEFFFADRQGRRVEIPDAPVTIGVSDTDDAVILYHEFGKPAAATDLKRYFPVRSEIRNSPYTREKILATIDDVTKVIKSEELPGGIKDAIQQIKSDRMFREGGVAYIPKVRGGELLVIGDLHGDLTSYLAVHRQHETFEKIKSGKLYVVFLGDYVIYGLKSVETMMEVMELKMDYPDRVVLVRGNHDERSSAAENQRIRNENAEFLARTGNRSTNFFDEMHQKYDAATYEAFMRLFEALPSLAVTGNGIVLAHAAPPSGNIRSLRDMVGNAELHQRMRNARAIEKIPTGFEREFLNWPQSLIVNHSVFDRFMNAIGGKVFIRGHVHIHPAREPIFSNRLETIVSAGGNSPTMGAYARDYQHTYGVYSLDTVYETMPPAAIHYIDPEILMSVFRGLADAGRSEIRLKPVDSSTSRDSRETRSQTRAAADFSGAIREDYRKLFSPEGKMTENMSVSDGVEKNLLSLHKTFAEEDRLAFQEALHSGSAAVLWRFFDARLPFSITEQEKWNGTHRYEHIRAISTALDRINQLDFKVSPELIRGLGDRLKDSKEILRLFFILHDYGRLARRAHTENGERLAEDLLKTLGYDAAKTEWVRKLILYHDLPHKVYVGLKMNKDLDAFDKLLALARTDFSGDPAGYRRLLEMLTFFSVFDILYAGDRHLTNASVPDSRDARFSQVNVAELLRFPEIAMAQAQRSEIRENNEKEPAQSAVRIRRSARSEIRGSLRSEDAKPKQKGSEGNMSETSSGHEDQKLAAPKLSKENIPGVLREGVASAKFISAATQADSMIRGVRNIRQQATVFVDAEDFSNLSLAQKQEYLIVALSNKALRVVVYNQRGETKDELLAALLKLDHVTKTGKDFTRAQISYDRANAPSIHLSKQILPSRELVQRLRKRVSFFKTQGQNGGTLAAALLWAWAGGEAARMREISQGRDGFWIVAETLASALQRSYDNNLVFASAA